MPDLLASTTNYPRHPNQTGNRQSAIGNRQSAIVNRQSAIVNAMLTAFAWRAQTLMSEFAVAHTPHICGLRCESGALVSAGIASLLEPQRGHRTRLQRVQPERPADGQLTRPGRQQKTMLTNTSGSGNLRPQLWTTFCRTTSLSSSGKASLPPKLLKKRPSASLPNRCEHSNGGHDAQQRRWRSLPARFRLI